MDVIIIGGGLAGLTCAHYLHQSGTSFQILEAGREVGGRVRTDYQEGYRFDRGFQVLLTSYPEAKNLLDFSQLNLGRFQSGAIIRTSRGFTRLADPWRQPIRGILSLMSPAATFRDRWAVARWRSRVLSTPLDRLLSAEEMSTEDALRRMELSTTIRESFLRPFFGGVFLESGLETSSRMLDFMFRMFSEGQATLPAHGMQDIPQQIASRLPGPAIRTEARVASLEGTTVILQHGERLAARFVVVATPAPECRRLLYDPYPAEGRSVTCLYFSMDDPPHHEPILVLNGTGRGPINNLAVVSAVSADYAPPGKSLVSVTVLGCPEDDQALEMKVRQQLEEWYGAAVRQWEMRQSYRIRYALPAIPCPALQAVAKPTLVRPGLFVCGDHCDTPSINGAMASGRRAAEGILAAMS